MSRTLQGQVDSLQKELDDLNTCAMRQVGYNFDITDTMISKEYAADNLP